MGEIIVYVFREILYKDFLLTFFFEDGSQRTKSFGANMISNPNTCYGKKEKKIPPKQIIIYQLHHREMFQ